LPGWLRLQTAPFDVSYLVVSWAAGPDAAAALAGCAGWLRWLADQLAG
jgi:hypothetical protein